jgi:hypothetical protein
MAVHQLREHVFEIALRFDAVELGGLDQRGEDRPVLGAAVGAGPYRIVGMTKAESSTRPSGQRAVTVLTLV